MSWLHHLFTHMPLALAPLAALYLVLAKMRANERDAGWARLTLYLAALSAVASAVTGLGSAEHLLESGVDAQKVALHRNASLVASAALIGTALHAYLSSRRHPRVTNSELALTVLANVALVVGGHFGGELLHPGMAPWSTGKHVHVVDEQRPTAPPAGPAPHAH